VHAVSREEFVFNLLWILKFQVDKGARRGNREQLVFSKSLVFWLFEELVIFHSDGSNTTAFFLLSSFFKFRDEHQARMNNRMGKAEAKFVRVGDEVVCRVIE